MHLIAYSFTESCLLIQILGTMRQQDGLIFSAWVQVTSPGIAVNTSYSFISMVHNRRVRTLEAKVRVQECPVSFDHNSVLDACPAFPG